VGTIVDTSVLIAAERGMLDLDALLESADEDDSAAIAAITASELLHGVHRLKGVRRAQAHMSVERLLAILPVVPFDLDVARVHATLSAELASKGAAVGAHDLMIAATAVHLDFYVATRDLRSFPRIHGLDVRRW
jgi:tRNA(fMet)-specific endonuclease VapC